MHSNILYSMLDFPDRFTSPAHSDPRPFPGNASGSWKRVSLQSHLDALPHLQIWIYTEVARVLYKHLA